MKSKRGSTLRAISALFGTVLLLLSLYLLNKANFVYGGIMGVVGILLITISIFPYMKFSPE